MKREYGQPSKEKMMAGKDRIEASGMAIFSAEGRLIFNKSAKSAEGIIVGIH